MKKWQHAHISFRPHQVDSSDTQRTRQALARLLSRPTDRLRAHYHAQGAVEFYAPTTTSWLRPRDREFLEGAGFLFLTVTKTLTEGAFGTVEVWAETWVDPTTTVKAEVRGPCDLGLDDEVAEELQTAGSKQGAIFLSTYFSDGSSVLLLPDDRFTERFADESRAAMSGMGRIEHDLPRFLERRQQLVQEGRVPLLCPDVATYVLHEELHGRYMFARQTVREVLWLRACFKLPIPLALLAIGPILAFLTGTHHYNLLLVGLGLFVRETWALLRIRSARYPQAAVRRAAERPISPLA